MTTRIVAVMLLGLAVLAGTVPVFAAKRGVTVEGQPPADYFAGQLGKSWAVVIGIDDYQNTNVRDLKYAVADAKAVARALEQRGYQVVALYNEKATRRAIQSELRTKLPRKVGKDDRVLIFYAGHGQDDKVEGGRPMGYLLSVDSDRDDVPATGISMGTVRELADALPAKHVLFLLDVCFGGIAGTVKRGQPPAVTEAYLKQITRERGRHLITAGEADQEVIEAPQWGHSVFTYFLLKGLNEGLADQDDNGIITAQELYMYLESRVFGEAKLQGHQQKPQFAELSGEKGQFVFFTSAGRHPSTLSRPQGGQASGGDLGLLPEAPVAGQKPPAPVQEARLPPYEGAPASDADRTGRDGAPMVLVPGGEFTAGSGSIARRVSVEAFFMDKYEVTAALYKKFLQAVSRKEPESWASASFPRDANRPVIGVDWQDADAYCRWAGKRLPTEMEWEKAARGTDGRLYPWGNDPPDPKRANYQKRAYNAYAEGLASVGSYEAGKSPYGLYDMAGNVWEWVADWYDDEYYRNGPARNPPGPPSGEEKVIRGGSWDFQAQAMLAASRLWFAPTMRAPFIGFRCAQDVGR